jgi:hypothetical protein
MQTWISTTNRTRIQSEALKPLWSYGREYMNPVTYPTALMANDFMGRCFKESVSCGDSIRAPLGNGSRGYPQPTNLCQGWYGSFFKLLQRIAQKGGWLDATLPVSIDPEEKQELDLFTAPPHDHSISDHLQPEDAINWLLEQEEEDKRACLQAEDEARQQEMDIELGDVYVQQQDEKTRD